MKKGERKNNIENRKSFFINAVAKFCDKCGSPYSPPNLEILQDSKSSSIIHFSCPSCKSEHVATFVKSMGIASRINVNTDLDSKEFAKFAALENTSPNEILEVYTFLKKNQEVKL